MAETPRLRGTLFDRADRAPEVPEIPSRLSGTLFEKASLEEANPSDSAPVEGRIVREPNADYPAYERIFRPAKRMRIRNEEEAHVIERNVAFLREQVRPLKSLYGSYAAILSGESPLNEPEGEHRLGSAHLKKRFDYSRGGALRPVSFHSHYFTGRDMEWLAERFPQDRYKFYLALRTDTDARRSAAERFSTELLERCADQHLSISTKSFDHNYDSFNVYTWEPDEMGDALRDLYGKYRSSGIFAEVPRFFQQAIPEVPIGAIGYVREPVTDGRAESARSHSVRMGVLGGYLDRVENDGGEVTEETFKDACQAAGVLPECPWEPILKPGG